MKYLGYALLGLTILLALGIIGLILAYIWWANDDRLIATAFLMGFVGIATTGFGLILVEAP